MINSVEKFLEIQINHIYVTFGDVLLRLGHSLLCRPSCSKASAASGGPATDPRSSRRSPRTPFVAPDLFQRCSQILSLTYLLHQMLAASRVFGFSRRPGRLGPFCCAH